MENSLDIQAIQILDPDSHKSFSLEITQKKHTTQIAQQRRIDVISTLDFDVGWRSLNGSTTIDNSH